MAARKDNGKDTLITRWLITIRRWSLARKGFWLQRKLAPGTKKANVVHVLIFLEPTVQLPSQNYPENTIENSLSVSATPWRLRQSFNCLQLTTPVFSESNSEKISSGVFPDFRKDFRMISERLTLIYQSSPILYRMSSNRPHLHPHSVVPLRQRDRYHLRIDHLHEKRSWENAMSLQQSHESSIWYNLQRWRSHLNSHSPLALHSQKELLMRFPMHNMLPQKPNTIRLPWGDIEFITSVISESI